MSKAIQITPAFSILMQTCSWVIINQDYAVGAYPSRQAARDAKAANNLEGKIVNKSEIDFEIVVPASVMPAEEAPIAPVGAEIEGNVHDYRCPHCGIGLLNGVGDHVMEVNGKDRVMTEKYEHWCMGCNGEFGPALKPKVPTAEKPARAINGPILHKSEIDHPCKRVWGIAEDMKKANPNIKRGAVLAACVAQGIAYYTARTQYQQWLGVQKEMAEREAAQAK